MRTKRSGNGFTLVELTVLIAILVALAAVVVPMMSGAARDEKLADLLRLVDTLRAASHRFAMETGRGPIEDSASLAREDHQLAFDPGIAGWTGPYLERPLTTADSPFGTDVEVQGRLEHALGGGFDLTGAGAVTATGAGAFVRFPNFPGDLAFLIDDAIDRGLGGDWRDVGRVRYAPASKKLDVFLFDLDGR